MYFDHIDADVLRCASNISLFTWFQEKGLLTVEHITSSEDPINNIILGVCPCLVDNNLVIFDCAENPNLEEELKKKLGEPLLKALSTASRLFVYAKQD